MTVINRRPGRALRTWSGFVSTLTVGSCLALTSGCVHKVGFRCELPPPVYLTLTAGKSLNPNEAGEALPTTVRVLQLASTVKAETLEANDFWDRPGEALGPDLVAQEEYTLEPGARDSHWLPRKGAANYLVAVAMFRQSKGSSWRTTIALKPVDEDRCPTEAPPPRSGRPGKEDVWVMVSLDHYDIEGSKVGAAR